MSEIQTKLCLAWFIARDTVPHTTAHRYSGDYTWSYRFFESILCGAIPIVEKNCGVYEGFKFFFFENDARTLNWSLEDAEYNYELCVEKLTVPKVALNEEIKKLIRIAE